MLTFTCSRSCKITGSEEFKKFLADVLEILHLLIIKRREADR